MANILDYIDWRGDLTFDQSEFNEVDNLILSKLAYVYFDDAIKDVKGDKTITIREANIRFSLLYTDEEIEGMYNFARIGAAVLKKISRSNRFSELTIKHFVNLIDYENESQFSALIIEINEKLDFASFSGTDNTVVGWKEDFTMSFLTPVPAQLKAVEYINRFGIGDRNLILGGHSKGGNLAVYAATKCDKKIKSRILEVYNNDGPGFTTEFINCEDYINIHERIRTIIPESSLIGILLEHEENYTVIKSNQKAVFQHNALSWEVLGNRFIHLDETSKFSKHLDKTLKSWMKSVSDEEKKEFTNALFCIFDNVEAKTIDEALVDKWATLKAITELNEDTRKILTNVVGRLLLESKKIIKEGLSKNKNVNLFKK